MSKRLQVVLSEAELDEIRQTARAQGVTVSEWVGEALRLVEVVEEAKHVVLGAYGLSARDALHVAVMKRTVITRIMSFDADYDPIPVFKGSAEAHALGVVPRSGPAKWCRSSSAGQA